MTLNEILEIDAQRAERWHTNGGLHEWSPLEWAGAMCGEAGEAANAAKKYKRMETGMASINVAERSFQDLEAARTAVAHECCDTMLYSLLLMARVGVRDAEAMMRQVFNAKSVEYGFPERL